MKYNITLSKSGISFFADSTETILEAALHNDIALPYSCKTGKCDTCLALCTKENAKAEEIKTCITKPSEDMTLELELLTELSGIKTKILPCRISKIEYLSDDIASLRLRTPPTQTIQFIAGQYIDLIKGDIRRSYSIASAPGSSEIELHIQRVDGGKFSEYLFENAKVNDLLQLEGPLGTFFRREKSINTLKPIIFLAGGTGFAPVQSMVTSVIENNDKSDVYIYWGNKCTSGFYTALPQDWANQYSSIHYIPVLSEVDEQRTWKGRLGFVHQAVLDDFDNLKDFDVFACGNPAMVEAAKQSFILGGLALSSFYVDAFIPNT